MSLKTSNQKILCNLCNSSKHKDKKCPKFAQLDAIIGAQVGLMMSRDSRYYKGQFLRIGQAFDKPVLMLCAKYLDRGVYCGSEYLTIGREGRTKPLSKYTKKQLVHELDRDLNNLSTMISNILEEKEQEAAAQEESCPICLESFEGKQTCTTKCGHSFCSSCFFTTMQSQIDQRGSSTCPLCRSQCLETRSRY